jgi:hypothetical protein
MKMRLLIISLIAPAFFVCTTASAQQTAGPVDPVTVPIDSPEAQRVEVLLSAYHELPSKAEFEKASDVRTILSTMARDRQAPRLQKRAIEALAYWPDAATLQVFEAVLADPQTRTGTRHFTLMTTGKAFGADGLDVLEPYLAASDLQLRLTAVDAVAATRSDRGFAMLEARARVETSDLVLDRIEKMGSRVR